jgi:prevent-host-death family protein
MAKARRKGAEQARNQLPSLLEDAAKGRTTIITRHGRSVAAIVPISSVQPPRRQKDLVALMGSGKGLWGAKSRSRLRRMRDEWSR